MRFLFTPCTSLIQNLLFNHLNSAIRKQFGDGVYGRPSNTAERKGALPISPLFRMYWHSVSELVLLRKCVLPRYTGNTA